MALAQLSRRPHPELRDCVEVSAQWRQGDPVAEIAAFALRESIDAIVLGARRWRLPWRATLADRLSRRIACPVVLVFDPARMVDASSRRSGRSNYAARVLAACGLGRASAEPEARWDTSRAL